jgi:hypothetical protein
LEKTMLKSMTPKSGNRVLEKIMLKSRAGMRYSTLLALCLLVSPAMGAEILNFPKPESKPEPMPAVVPGPVPAPAQPSLRPAGITGDCKEWTDSCRVCVPDDKGAPACSNIGIACLPEKWRCTRP